MPIPFAQIDSEDSHLTNLQLYFWRCAVETFEQMCEVFDDYVEDEAAFCVDASILLVLAGTSVSQLLGQQWRDGIIKEDRDKPDRVPEIRELIDRMIGDTDKENLVSISPSHVKSSFKEFIKVYDGIRHFGEPKQKVLDALTHKKVTEFMETLQHVWRIVAKMRPHPSELRPVDFGNDFQFPDSSCEM